MIKAAAAVRPALSELERDNLLRDGVAAKASFGNAVRSYGKLRNNVPVLQCAVTAYREILAKISRDKSLREWALTKDNLARGLASIADRTDKRYEAAIAAIEDAIVFFRGMGETHYLGKAVAFRQRLEERPR